MWAQAGGALTVPLQLLQLTRGRIQLPNDTEALYLEIGTNSFDTYDQKLLPKQPKAFLLSFEPLLDKWATLLARNSRSRQFSRLGYHHQRGIALPFAVSDHDGFADFHISPRDGCSSLRPAHTPEYGNWKYRSMILNACAKTVELRRVPCVSLRTVIHDWLGGHPVSRIKIDAQAHDLEIVRAAGMDTLQLVEEISMEGHMYDSVHVAQ
ncbi:MAG: hypothetical protein SGPRY_005725 [Prymnesium sp.]